MSVASMKELLEAGVHFGHYTRRWNPKMRPYIFTERNGIHIIDLAQTVEAIDRATRFVRDTVAKGGTVLFVGTKKQATETIRQAAEGVGMPYVTDRWLGGMLTNCTTIRQRVDHLLELERRRDRGEFAMLPKHEVLLLEREIEKLNRRLGGIKTMGGLPDVLYVVDTRREEIAVREAKSLGIPIVAMVDTNCDPDPVTFVIPSNDDAIRALKVITDKMAEAVDEGSTSARRPSWTRGSARKGPSTRPSASSIRSRKRRLRRTMPKPRTKPEPKPKPSTSVWPGVPWPTADAPPTVAVAFNNQGDRGK